MIKFFDPLRNFTLIKKYLYSVGVIACFTIYTTAYIVISLHHTQVLLDQRRAATNALFSTNQNGTIGLATLSQNSYTQLTNLSNEIEASVATTQKNTVLLVGTIFVLIFLVCLFLIRSVSLPLRELMQKTREISQGNLEAKVAITSRDELGELSQIFNQMTMRLNESYHDLENKIQRRTSDLQKFRMAVESSSDHIIITDPNGIILYANRAAERITGYRKEEMVGKTPALWGKQMSQDFYRRLWDSVKKQKTSFKSEFNNRRKNGEDYVAEVEISPVLDGQNELLFLVGIERDVTEEREIEKAKTEFVSLASHQLRTPLTSIKWYTSMLLDGDAGKLLKKQGQYVEQIKSGTQHMVELVNKLLNISRIELGSFITKPEKVEPGKLVTTLAEEARPFLDAKKLDMRILYPKKIPSITTDAQLFRVIFQNILNNAIKYTGSQGHITVKFSTKAPEGRPDKLDAKTAYAYISVTDTGCGIPEHQQDKIFQKFFRADNVHDLDTEGTGLGLYMSKAIIEHLGGAIWFQSKEKKGSTFSIAIPVELPASVLKKNLEHQLALTSII